MNATNKAALALATIFLLALATVHFKQKETLRVVALLQYSVAAPIGGFSVQPELNEFDTRAETFLANFEALLRTSMNSPEDGLSDSNRDYSLHFKAVDNTNLIQVSMQSQQLGQEDLINALNDLVDQALERRRDNSQAFFNQEIQRIYDKRDTLETQRFLERQNQIKAQEKQLEIQIAELEEQIMTLQRSNTNSAPKEPPPAAQQQSDQAAFLTYSHDFTLNRLNLELHQYRKQLESSPPGSPLRPSLTEEIKRTEQEIAQINRLKDNLLRRQPNNSEKTVAIRNPTDAGSQAEMKRIQGVLARLRTELKQIRQSASTPDSTDEAHNQAIEDLEVELEHIVRTASSAIQVRWFKRPTIEQSRQ